MTQVPLDPNEPGSTVSDGARSGRVVVIANTRSGRDESMASRMLQHVRHRLDTMRLEYVGLPPEHGDIGQQLDSAKETPADLVVAIGGDGTVNGSAAVALLHGARLAIVPTGTLNLVASDLGIEATEEQVDSALIGWRETVVDVGYVNEQLFLHSSHLGLVPSLAQHRERVRAAEDTSERIAGARDWLAGCVQSPEQKITCSDGDRTVTLTTLAVAVTVNLLEESGPLHYVRPQLDAGVLGVYASAHAGGLATVNAVASLAMGRFASDPDTLHARCTKLELSTAAPSVTLCNDGELIDVKTPCIYRVAPRALRVLVPAKYDGGSG